MEDNPPAANQSQSLKDPRYVRKIFFSFRVLSAAEGERVVGETVEAETYDISAGGLRFKSDLTWQLDAEVELTLHLSSSFEPTFVGRVLRSDYLGDEKGKSSKLIALQFIGLEPEMQAQIRESLTPKFSLQKGSEEAGTQADEEAQTIGWSKVGITELSPQKGKLDPDQES